MGKVSQVHICPQRKTGWTGKSNSWLLRVVGGLNTVASGCSSECLPAGTVGCLWKSYSELPDTHFPECQCDLVSAMETQESLLRMRGSGYGRLSVLKKDPGKERVSYTVCSPCFCPAPGFDAWSFSSHIDARIRAKSQQLRISEWTERKHLASWRLSWATEPIPASTYL